MNLTPASRYAKNRDIYLRLEKNGLKMQMQLAKLYLLIRCAFVTGLGNPLTTGLLSGFQGPVLRIAEVGATEFLQYTVMGCNRFPEGFMLVVRDAELQGRFFDDRT